MRHEEVVRRALRILGSEAAEMEIDVSFREELLNYAGHQKVTELSDDDLCDSITTIGRIAMGIAPGRAGGGHVRTTIMYLCPGAFHSCDEAARNALVVQRQPGEPSLEAVKAKVATFGRHIQHLGIVKDLGIREE